MAKAVRERRTRGMVRNLRGLGLLVGSGMGSGLRKEDWRTEGLFPKLATRSRLGTEREREEERKRDGTDLYSIGLGVCNLALGFGFFAAFLRDVLNCALIGWRAHGQ